ncbi:phosphoserine aminotransferase 1, chloroplastic-like [Selaginella moellendorffii]|uniref:phosphoserine aminotransferase 1, chloroplastic-like n=1 Tax=Selaginella moellendorffii TaxID=88036 RepID=UPI000D1CE616|nr:phosphoserine aminotransferase 1, chloroplastic-like [Selaginella moellendorffii]|eukprot:XP_024520745.1 phosphoserine aminotransferase 1, chloroplastic-like [Selaginella moellendorffii]
MAANAGMARALVARSTFLGGDGRCSSPASQVSPFSRVRIGHPDRRQREISCTATVGTGIAPSSRIESIENDGRVYNFAAGPATLPANVVKKAQQDLYNWQGCGMSIMEMSHRGKEFLSVIQKAEADLRALLAIPDNYEVLFLQGGASTLFSAIPLNLCSPEDTADFIVTGSWGDKAYKEAQKYCKANLAWSGKATKYTSIPSSGSELKLTPGAKFVHVCTNETIHGVEFKDWYPAVGEGTILVADMSSNFCSKPVDVSKFGVIYAGAQKNVGPSGVTIAIVRKDLVGGAQPITPVMLDFKTHADNKSLYNTPPCFAIYMCGLVFEDLLHQGGLEAIARKNNDKAEILYRAIDGSDGFYKCPVEASVRSVMNVPFTMASPEMEAAFVKEAAGKGMVQLKGHRSVGGVRASIYNAMPRAGVEKLVALMKDFQARHQAK